MYMDWRKIYWIFFYGKVLTFQYMCSLLLSVREVSSWEMSAFISTTWYHDFFVDWLHSPYLYYSIEHCTVTISSHLGCKCAKGTGIQIYSIIKEKKAWRKYEFLHHYYNGHRPHGYPLLEFVTNVYILDGYKFTKSKHPGVWRQGRKHIKNKDFFSTVTPDG